MEVTSCQVKLRILVGWCGGEYVAENYMHSFIETHRTLIKTTKAQCHHSSPNDTLEIELPPYGTINRIRILMHLEGGVGEASFQPAGYSRPNSDCEGIEFTPPPNKQTRITYLDYSAHLREKAIWSTKKIRRAVVTYQISAKVVKKIGYVTAKGRKLVIPNVISIERSPFKLPADGSSNHRGSIKDMAIYVLN